MFWRIMPKRMWGLGLILIATLATAFFFLIVRSAETNVTDQVLRRRLTLARAQATNVASFFHTFGQSIAVFANLSSMQQIDSTTLSDMTVFVNQWRDTGLIGGVVLTNNQGIVKLNANVLGTSDVGASLADRDYFSWAKKEPRPEEYFIGQPVISRLGATKGQVIVPVAAAVYKDDAFIGALTSSIKLEPLTDRYLALMKVSATSQVYLTDTNGQIWYSSADPGTIGSSIFSLFPKLQTQLTSYEEGKLTSTQNLIAYSPLEVANQRWWVILISPITDVTDFTSPIYIRQILILVLESVAILLFGIIVATNKHHQKTLS